MTLPPDVLAELIVDVASRMGWPEGGSSGLRAWLHLSEPEGGSSPYDLASPTYDLPPHEPGRSLVIATDYRSGSTLLAEGLAGAGGYGVPMEYAQRGAMERRFARFASPSPDEYLRAVMRARTSDTGVFGIKLFWPEAQTLDLLPAPVIVWLRRRDVVAQAVSTWSALVTGEWRSPRATERDVPYDRQRLAALVAMHAHHDRSWEQTLRDRATIEVAYEDLAADPVRVTTVIVDALAQAGMPPEGSIPRPRLARQAGTTSALLTARLGDDLLHRHWT